MSYDDYAKRHETLSKEFVAATFTAISEYERVIADPAAKATDVALARDGLARAMRAMGTDPYPLDGDLNVDAGAMDRISAIASTVAPTKPGDVAAGIQQTIADVMAEQDAPTLSEQALEQVLLDIHEMRDERGKKIAVKPTKVWPFNYPYDGREI